MIDSLGSASVVALVLLAFIAGLALPFRFALERLRGFGRWFVSKLPYRPPPGQDEQDALEEATEE
jgi:hypothetical protein